MTKDLTLNRAQLDSIRRLGKSANRDLIVEFSGTLIAEFPQRKAIMQSAITDKNCKLLELQAHTLIGIYGHLGADKMILLCERLERCGRDEDLSQADEMLNEITQEHARFLGALAAYQSESPVS